MVIGILKTKTFSMKTIFFWKRKKKVKIRENMNPAREKIEIKIDIANNKFRCIVNKTKI